MLARGSVVGTLTGAVPSAFSDTGDAGLRQGGSSSCKDTVPKGGPRTCILPEA